MEYVGLNLKEIPQEFAMQTDLKPNTLWRDLISGGKGQKALAMHAGFQYKFKAY